ncbi:MAG: L-2-hydroxyglutarate oxidase [Candidatus Omnitrophota bacterium]
MDVNVAKINHTAMALTKNMNNYNYIIIGAGIVGLTIAKRINELSPIKKILIIDKESTEAFHASSRNSGVLHAGFYYTADSLKAKFTVDGNNAMRKYCADKNIPINTCGKLVVATNEAERVQLHDLHKRGVRNGSNVSIISEAQALAIEPNVITHKEALFSPDTASVAPKVVCQKIKEELVACGVTFLFDTAYKSHKLKTITTTQGDFTYDQMINCAGLYADKIARDFGFSQKYTIIPFKGLYLKYTKNKTDIKTNIYPVPNLKYPFLGVHFTKTVTNEIKIGPTAIPAFWRENYDGFDNFKFSELASIMWEEAKLFCENASGFRDLAFEEAKKYKKSYFIKLAQDMVRDIDPAGFTTFTKPGIRAQLLDLKNRTLVQDFLIEADNKTIHVLNAVSPAFTCSFPFAEHIVENYLNLN